MIPTEQARRIVGTLGVAVSDGEVQKVAARILQDNLCSGRILEFLLAQHAPEVLQSIHPLEKEALIQRLRIAGTRPALVPHGKARWVASVSPVPGRPQIIAACSACSQSMKFMPAIGAGHLGRDFSFSHCGQNEICPDDVLHKWYELCAVKQVQPDREYTRESLEAGQAEAAAEMARQDRVDFVKHGGKL